MVFRSSLRRLEAAPIYSFEVDGSKCWQTRQTFDGPNAVGHQHSHGHQCFEYMSCSFRHLRAALHTSFSYYGSLLAAFERPIWHDSNRFKRAIGTVRELWSPPVIG